MRDQELREQPVPQPVENARMQYIPSRLECLKDYEIRIRFLDRGCIVEVGCKSIAFENIDSAMLEINNYVNDPYNQGTKWRKVFGME